MNKLTNLRHLHMICIPFLSTLHDSSLDDCCWEQTRRETFSTFLHLQALQYSIHISYIKDMTAYSLFANFSDFDDTFRLEITADTLCLISRGARSFASTLKSINAASSLRVSNLQDATGSFSFRKHCLNDLRPHSLHW
uniref:Uncharacterized protein n=1 Tax=Pristionchus pacificus TaxID=54126 RepID=A0A8R1YRQ6_PRIPA